MALDAGPPEAEVLLPGEEPPLPPGGATPQELRAHPGLARLLRGLGRALGPQGLSPALGRDLRQAEAGLALRRGAWLRWESLWRGLQELRRDPRGLRPPVLRELEQALALAELRRGAPALATLLPEPQDPAPLRALLLPALERRLAEKAAELSGYQGASPAGTARALAAQRRRLHRARHRRRHLGQLLARQRRAYPEVLGRCAALLGRLAGERGAGAWAEAERGRAGYLEAKGAAILLKIRLEELALLRDTYPPATVEAHRRIRAGLEAASGRAAGEAARARAALEAFAGLGPAFARLAGEYGRLRERLRHRRWALRQLRRGGGGGGDGDGDGDGDDGDGDNDDGGDGDGDGDDGDGDGDGDGGATAPQ